MSKNRAFVRYTKSGKIIPGSLVVTNGTYPKDGTYVEVFTNECCDPNKDGNSSLPLKVSIGMYSRILRKVEVGYPSTPDFNITYTPGALNTQGQPKITGNRTTIPVDQKKIFCFAYHSDADYPKAGLDVEFIDLGKDRPDTVIKCQSPEYGGDGWVTSRNNCKEYILSADGEEDCIFEYFACDDPEAKYVCVHSGDTLTVCVDEDALLPAVLAGVGSATPTTTLCSPS